MMLDDFRCKTSVECNGFVGGDSRMVSAVTVSGSSEFICIQGRLRDDAVSWSADMGNMACASSANFDAQPDTCTNRNKQRIPKDL